MNSPLIIAAMALFGVSAVFRFITHILEMKERNDAAGTVAP
jgi:hypothetical protein